MLKTEIMNFCIALDLGELFSKSDSPETGFTLKIINNYFNNDISTLNGNRSFI